MTNVGGHIPNGQTDTDRTLKSKGQVWYVAKHPLITQENKIEIERPVTQNYTHGEGGTHISYQS